MKYYLRWQMALLAMSLLTQESGLKSEDQILKKAREIRSLLTQESGLKYAAHRFGLAPDEVSPYTGEWIEIKSSTLVRIFYTSLSLHRRVD